MYRYSIGPRWAVFGWKKTEQSTEPRAPRAPAAPGQVLRIVVDQDIPQGPDGTSRKVVRQARWNRSTQIPVTPRLQWATSVPLRPAGPWPYFNPPTMISRSVCAGSRGVLFSSSKMICAIVDAVMSALVLWAITRISSPWRIKAARCCRVTYWLSTVSYSLRLE